MNLHDLFAIAHRRVPEKLVLEVRDETGAVTAERSYNQLLTEADALAAGLAAWGLGKGDRAAVQLGNGLPYVVAWLALLRLGAVLVPVNPSYKRRELAHILADAEPRLLLVEPAGRALIDELAPEERGSVEALIEGGELAAWAGDPAALAPPLVDGGDPAAILYTSGTTGRSKGAVLTHDNLLSTITALLAAWAWEPEDVLLLALPLVHVHGLVVGLATALAAGGTVLLERRFDAARAVDELAAGRASMFFGVPTLYVRLVEELRRRQPLPDLSRLRLFCAGSAPLAPETFEAFRELAGHDVLERYGMTEAGMILSNPYAGPRRPGTVGTPLPGVSVRVAGEDGREVAPGEVGEVLVRGPNVFAGYWRDPAKTAAAFREDEAGQRWLASGDLARRDPETGSITLLGRRHELILCGGYNVYPREIEEVLVTCPGVAEAAIVGRPDPEWGEVPVAYLVLGGPGAEALAAGEEGDRALATFCREHLAGYKVPRAFHRLDVLPRNALGKLQKHLLPR